MSIFLFLYHVSSHLWHVRRSGLDCSSCLWSCALQRHDDLELGLGQVLGRDGVQGRAGVDPVVDHHGPEGLDDVTASVQFTMRAETDGRESLLPPEISSWQENVQIWNILSDGFV